MISADQTRKFTQALPFWVSLALIPLIAASAAAGGWWLLLVPACAWWLYGIVDAAMGLQPDSADPTTSTSDLFWYRLITLIWLPLQLIVVFTAIWYAQGPSGPSNMEKLGLFFGVGVLSGTIGITYAHELMHQKSRLERWVADLLMASVLYSHFRSEHLLVHHRYVGTRRDPVTARYNEGFHRFFPRVLVQSPISAFSSERAMLARKGLPWWHSSNPFWRYAALQAGFLGLAFLLGGWGGVGLFAFQAFVAIWQLELVNYVEHYGLTREHLGEGKYEHVKPHHSWNASHRFSNWLLINLQRHSDHHFKPDRPFPLLQSYGSDEAPQLPLGYQLMTGVAMMPPVWRRVMNPRVQDWRKQHYPGIVDWTPYNFGMHPPPR